MNKDYSGVTGRLIKQVGAGKDLEEYLYLIRIGISFAKQRSGSNRGYIYKLVYQYAKDYGAPYSFERLIRDLKFNACIYSNTRGFHVVSVDQDEEYPKDGVIIFYHPKKGEIIRTFSAMRRHLTNVNKKIRNS